MFNKVFISYASEDFSYAEKLYDFLLMNGYVPWLDKKQLKVGQLWDVAIKEGLRNAHFVLILFSDTSVNKRGYVQREFKMALDYCEERLDSDTYILPVKVNACEIPVKFAKHQWVNYSEEAFERILDSLNHQQAKYIEEFEKKK